MLTSFLRSEVTRHSSHSCSTLYHPGILQCKKPVDSFTLSRIFKKKEIFEILHTFKWTLFEPWCIYISSNQAKNETRVSWDRVYIVLMDFSSKIAWMSLSETCSQFRIYHIIQISVRNLGAISAVFPSHGWLMIHLSSVACKYIMIYIKVL